MGPKALRLTIRKHTNALFGKEVEQRCPVAAQHPTSMSAHYVRCALLVDICVGESVDGLRNIGLERLIGIALSHLLRFWYAIPASTFNSGTFQLASCLSLPSCEWLSDCFRCLMVAILVPRPGADGPGCARDSG
jgi:hypothetical protein